MRLGIALRAVANLSPRQRIFSGIQPTGTLHLGNYFGAVEQWVREIQSEKQCDLLVEQRDQRIFSVVDLHAITLPQDPKILRENILTMTASLIGCGLDPDKAILFQQSHVKEHAELNWILGTFVTVNRLQVLAQFKDKSKQFAEKGVDVPVALLNYPVLQAADILLYKATKVPVGEDNRQNLEVASNIAKKFNNHYKCQLFPIPETVVVTEKSSRRIKSLRSPENKMSKSEKDQKSCIYVLDDPDTIRLKIKKAVTDFTSKVTFEPDNRPGVANLVCIHSRITGEDTSTICDEYARGMETAQYKLLLADVIVNHFAPIRQKTMDLLKNKEHLEAILKKGSDRAQVIAAETLNEVKSVVGLR